MPSQAGVLWCSSFHPKEERGAHPHYLHGALQHVGRCLSMGSPAMSGAKMPPCSVTGLLVARTSGPGGPKFLSHKGWVACWQDPLAVGLCLGSCHHPGPGQPWPKPALGQLSVTGSGILPWDPAAPPCHLPHSLLSSRHTFLTPPHGYQLGNNYNTFLVFENRFPF